MRALLDEAVGPQDCEAGRFIDSGLRAARHSHRVARPAILADVAGLLECSVEDLGFLFAEPLSAANDTDPVTMPDYRNALRTASRLHAAE